MAVIILEYQEFHNMLRDDEIGTLHKHNLWYSQDSKFADWLKKKGLDTKVVRWFTYKGDYYIEKANYFDYPPYDAVKYFEP